MHKQGIFASPPAWKLVAKNMNGKNRKIHISKIIEAERCPNSGVGMMGFVITYPGGRIENRVLEYSPDTHDETFFQISKQRQALLSENRSNSNNKKQSKKEKA